MLLPKRKKQFTIKEGYVMPIVLDYRVSKIVEWYRDKMVKGNYTDVGEFSVPIEFRNLIEKMAVWYELRYPDSEVYRIMFGSNNSSYIDKAVFNDNPYVNEQLDSESEVRILDWVRFYNFDTFLKSLSPRESYYFKKYQYPEIVYFDKQFGVGHLHLNSDGIVEMDEFSYNGKEEGKHIKEVVEDALKDGIKFPSDSEILEVLENANNKDKLIDEMLNAVMYRILERGGNRTGAHRAYLFAKEFNRNLDIPLMYGVDTSDPGLREFINRYLNDGGNPDLVCYLNYSSRSSNHEILRTMSIRELLKFSNGNCFYTSEEKELHQKLVNVLSRRLEK